MTTLFGESEQYKIVNVATVPMRSPFRYPGEKTWLVPTIRQWLNSLQQPVSLLVEPFAGGGIVGLTAAFEKLVNKVMLVELDADIASVWLTILNGKGEWLADEIAGFDLTPEAVHAISSGTPTEYHLRALATIVRNRVNRGGILAPGAGIVKNGENGKGLRSRWYPDTLRRRVLDIIRVKDRIEFHHGDGIEMVERYAGDSAVAFFIDPPYTVAGRRLYTHSEINHRRLFQVVQSIAGSFLMTYDDSIEIRDLAKESGFATRLIPMKSTHHVLKSELLIARKFDWLSS